MHLALLHDGRPALLRVEGPPGAPLALFFHPFPLHADVWEEMLTACAAAGLCAAARSGRPRGGPRRLASDSGRAAPPRSGPATMASPG